MPPLSPVPGWANGDVCTLSIATRRTDIGADVIGQIRASERPRGRGPPLVLEGVVDLEEGLLLAVGQGRITVDRLFEAGVRVALLEDPGPHVERLGRDPQRLGDLLEDVRARLAQPPFDLAQVGVRDAGEVAQVPQREPGAAPLLPDERAEIVEPLLERVGHG